MDSNPLNIPGATAECRRQGMDIVASLIEALARERDEARAAYSKLFATAYDRAVKAKQQRDALLAAAKEAARLIEALEVMEGTPDSALRGLVPLQLTSPFTQKDEGDAVEGGSK